MTTMRVRKLIMRAVIVLTVLVASAALWQSRVGRDAVPAERIGARSQILPVDDVDLARYARAVEPYAWSFPADHGPHPTFQTEWWYYTGNLEANGGRRFGYQFTVFRRAIASKMPESSSEWRTNQLYMAHLTITDVERRSFFQDQRFSRGAAGLAGATADPRYRVWLEDWQVQALDDAAEATRITAGVDDFGVDLQLGQLKQPVLQGVDGLSAKSSEPGNASYYYSLSRLATDGVIRIGSEEFAVSGFSWMDHEFSTSALGDSAQGWDWFGLHLDDGRDLMVGRIRLVGGGFEPAFGGLLVDADGQTRYLAADDFEIAVLNTWISPNTGAEYPAEWRISVAAGDDDALTLHIAPLISDQELLEGTIVYWEGAVRVTGEVSGFGYAELTGYFQTMRGRF